MLNCYSGLFLQLPPELEVPRSVQALSSRYLGEKKKKEAVTVCVFTMPIFKVTELI